VQWAPSTTTRERKKGKGGVGPRPRLRRREPKRVKKKGGQGAPVDGTALASKKRGGNDITHISNEAESNEQKGDRGNDS